MPTDGAAKPKTAILAADIAGYSALMGADEADTVRSLAGRDVESKRVVARLLEVDPTLRMSALKNSLPPSQRPEYLIKYADALQKAGLPD